MKKQRKQRKVFSKDFKIDAVNRSNRVGVQQTCNDLGIGLSTLQRWRREHGASNGQKNEVSQDLPSYQELEKEVGRLKKELSYVNEINRILKKSTAIFSQENVGLLK